MSEFLREDLELLRDCTANLEVKLDCSRAIAGDAEATERCAKILRRAMPCGERRRRWPSGTEKLQSDTGEG